MWNIIIKYNFQLISFNISTYRGCIINGDTKYNLLRESSNTECGIVVSK